MKVDWSPLKHELGEWRAAGLTLPLWWRDDDAVAPTESLARLESLSATSGVPVHLAMIPSDATRSLADDLSDSLSPWCTAGRMPTIRQKARKLSSEWGGMHMPHAWTCNSHWRG